MVVGVCSFANTAGDCTSTPGGFARLTPSVLQWIQQVKVNSWQHEMEMRMLMNSKKILENGNETRALKNQISEAIIDKSTELSVHYDNENKDLKKTINMMGETIEKVKEEVTSLKDIIVKNKDYMESRDRMNQEITLLKDENEKLKKANKEIESSLKVVSAFIFNEWKVQKKINHKFSKSNFTGNSKARVLWRTQGGL